MSSQDFMKHPEMQKKKKEKKQVRKKWKWKKKLAEFFFKQIKVA